MIKSRFTILCIATASMPIVLASPAAAQSPAAPPAPPAASPQGGPPAAPRSEKTQSALKLAGLVTFVANSCPTLTPNYGRFEEAINALGVAKTDLDAPDMKAGYIGYAARYNADVKTSCQRAEAQFGPHGTTLADIFEPRAK